MSRIGIYGGTFDPIHHGHLITAQFVKEKRKLEKIIFIPAFIPPFKQSLKISPPEHRLKMLQLSIEGIPYFDYSDIELKRKNISYTIDTLKELKRNYNEIELIIGMDNFQSFNDWKSPEKIIELAKLVVLRRRTDKQSETENKFKENAVFLETPLIEISATDIRERVKNDLPINFLVPKNVMEYIYKQKLYKD